MVDGQWLYFSYNHRGDVVTVTRPDGTPTNRFEYDAFGNPLTCSPLTARRSPSFSSKEYDFRSGLSYYGYRYYDAQSGRWMTKDKDFMNFLLVLDPYVYVRQSPHYWIDSYGLTCERVCQNGVYTWVSGKEYLPQWSFLENPVNPKETEDDCWCGAIF